MKEVIKTKYELCTGCNRCVRECPMEMVNITYQDENGNIKVKVDNTKCIACGMCISVCTHNARYYEDDIELFFNDLLSGASISLISAPSIRTNIPNFKKLFTYLKNIGVKKIYDVSLGADICIWAHVRYIEQNDYLSIITQPCPSIVSYCQIYQHDLIKHLSPVHSPMACIAIYMKEYEQISDRIVALSPCISKRIEFDEVKTIHYNVTFSKLLQYIEKNNIVLPEEESEFDHYEGGFGSLFPMPGGLKENIEYHLGKQIHIEKSEGRNVYQKLDSFQKTSDSFLPQIFDVLNCKEGCNSGPGCLGENNFFETCAAMAKNRKAVSDSHKREYFTNLYKSYDNILELSHFMRKYEPIYTQLYQITENDIMEAFKLLNKNDYEKQTVNCGACGSDTCYNMARKIALKVNIPDNCIIMAMDNARIEHEINLLAYKENLRQTKVISEMLERFETIWDKVESGIVMIDAETRQILDANPVAVRMFGAEKSDIVGKKCHHFICPIGENLCPIIDGNYTIDRSEREFINSNGKKIPIIKSVSKIDYNDRLVILESFTDISYIKEAEEQVRLLHITEQANQAKSDFLSKMSHEIRTPMNAISGMTQIAKKTNDVSKLKYCMSVIENSSNHLLGIINDILDMSKIEAGKLTLENLPINIEKILMKVCNLIIEKIDQKNIKFNVILNKDMGINFIGDGLRISQVVTNLLSNAVKFTPDEGKIEIAVHEVQVEGDYSILKFSVSDTGIGVTDEQKNRLFKPFEQAEGSTARQFGGTGLGLAISKNIVEKMDGNIWVDSTPGKGSVFYFDVKLKRLEKQADSVLVGSIKPSDVNTLVISEDNKEREYFISITNSFGIKTSEADSGSRALDLVKSAKTSGKYFDVIFIDYNLTDMECIESIKKIKEETDGNSTIVIMISFFKWHKIEKEAFDIGVKRFIPKPFFPSAIFDSINEIISSPRKSLHINDKAENISDMPDMQNLTILFSEDIEINREIFISLLEETKAKIDIAENGLIAVRKFKENPDKYNVIIMDIQMPVMNGYEATKTIRSLDIERAKTIPIIAMTANAFKEDIDACLASGMNDHLAKPIDINAVIGKISLYCGLSEKSK
ncbi:MAG: response regulator [Spirochaetaceae bacterium]|nr:response regulator [Spirochaetaceae bacterium]